MTKTPTMTEADFTLFTVLWNQRQNMRTPAIHFTMARWLEAMNASANPRLLLQAFRGSGKSTLAALFSAWLLYRNPDLRILVIAADEALAAKMVRNVKRILERHPLTAHLKPKGAEEWGGDRFTVRRWLALRDPSMLAKGIGANITGTRADVIICDDVEVPNTSDTAHKRLDLRERLAELSFILTPGGTMLYLGTPHTYYTIYADAPRTEIGEERAFLQGFERMLLPIIEDGKTVWPERFPQAHVEQILATSGPARFASQMLLQPRNIAQARLDPALLNFYDAEIDYTRELQSLFIGGRKMISASAWWDPAFGSASGDRSVLAVVYADGEGRLYLHRVVYIRPSPPYPPASGGEDIRAANTGGENQNEAQHQCRIIAQQARELYLPSITVETNGIGKFLPGLLRNEMARSKTPCSVVEAISRRKKEERILESFDVLLAARRLFVHRSIQKTPFIAEMQEWQADGKGRHDDGLDAAAGALAQQPVRLMRLYGSGAQNWMSSARPAKGKTEFEV